jgi:hypothetical protein
MTEQLEMFSGAGRKRRGMAIVETAEAIHGRWVKQADATIEWLAMKGDPFSAEDVRAYVGDPAHPNAMGARINAAARKGLIIKAGTVKADRPERHANEMRLWIGRRQIGAPGEEIVGYLYGDEGDSHA